MFIDFWYFLSGPLSFLVRRRGSCFQALGAQEWTRGPLAVETSGDDKDRRRQGSTRARHAKTRLTFRGVQTEGERIILVTTNQTTFYVSEKLLIKQMSFYRRYISCKFPGSLQTPTPIHLPVSSLPWVLQCLLDLNFRPKYIGTLEPF